MWIREAGEVNGRLMLLGTPKNSVYLVKGDRHMLIGGGGQWMVQELGRQIREFHIDMDRVQYLLIGHSHYDHCGAVPYLQKRYPHLKVLASHGAEKLYAMEKAMRNMRTFSHQVMETRGLPMEFEGVSLDFDEVRVERALREGDHVDLGSNLSFNVFETPGHSRCAMTLYEPKQQWLFPSDSMAFPFPARKGDEFMPTASESFVVYLNSLKKLANLGIRLCAWEHYGMMTDEDARDIVQRVIRSTLEYKDRLLGHLDKLKDEEKVAQWAARDWKDKTEFEFVPYNVMLHITRVMVKNAVEEQVEKAF